MSGCEAARDRGLALIDGSFGQTLAVWHKARDARTPRAGRARPERD